MNVFLLIIWPKNMQKLAGDDARQLRVVCGGRVLHRHVDTIIIRVIITNSFGSRGKLR